MKDKNFKSIKIDNSSIDLNRFIYKLKHMPTLFY